MAANSQIGSDAVGATSLAGFLIVLGVMIGDATVGLLLGLLAFFLVVYCMFRVPIRHSMMALMFLALTLPNPAEGQPTEWAPPFSIVGQVLLNHLNSVDRDGLLGMIPVAAMEILFFVLFLIRLLRKSSGSRLDRDALPTPKPLIQMAWLSLAATGFTWMSGILRGGDFAMSLWQVNAVIYLPIVFLLFQTSFRGPKDHWNLAKIVLAAATYRALLATYVVYTTVLPMDPNTGNTKPPYGTAHADSVLFSSAILIIVGMVLERVHRRTKWLVVVLLPIIVLGTHANGRRLAWVQIGVALLMVYLVSRDNPVKRALRRAVVVAVPFVALYVLIGWDRTYGAVWKPVRLIRSVVDAKSDGSSMWREYENVNIIATFRSNPIFGTGYGHPYQEVVVLPAIEYPLERWIPHNSLLGLWGYSGLIGFLGVTLLWTTGVYFAMRAYHKATDPSQRVGALVAFGVVPIYMMQAWGDLGLGQWTGVFAMGAALTVAGKVAVSCGQWPGAPARKAAATSPGPG